MPANSAIVKSSVQTILSENFSGVELWKGGFTLRHGSSRVFISFIEQEERTLVKLVAPLLSGCRADPALFREIALRADDYFFGHLSASETEDGVDVFFTHLLLGDYLDERELVDAIGGILITSDDLDDDLAARFGGERFHEG